MKRKITLLTGLGALMMLFAGCLVVSVYPYYNEKDLTFEPGLVGRWTKAASNEHWLFEKDGTNAYRLTVADDQSTNAMQAHLFKLKGQKFMDLYAPDAQPQVQPPPIPSHILLRVQTLSPNASFAVLDFSWLQQLLAKDPKALRHEVIKTNDKPEERPIALTADTAALQAFLIKHLGTKEAWSDEFTLKRD